MTTNRLRNFDMGTLRSFVTIVESGSMTRAASRLFMTQSAISMQIKRLEGSLGISVFDRSAKGMTTTVEGEQLLHFAHQMLAINDEGIGRLTSADYEGKVRFGAPSDVIYPHIPGVLKEFNRDYPRVQIKLSSGSTSTLMDQYDRGLQDVVLTTEITPRQGGQVISTQPLIWTGAEQGISWKKRPLPLGNSKNCAFYASAIKALDTVDIDWIDTVAAADETAIEAMISADLCISAELKFARHSGRVAIEHGGQLPDLPEFSIVLYCSNQPSNQLTQTFVEYLLRAYA
ncbi:MAG: DNA-binding transcriptional LysR family regulator [Gammaproteobacteria bacterium]|jgi:DNA-binding transcriptional LysR family regulator